MDNKITIRQMTPQDVPAVKALFTSVFTKEPWNDDWSDTQQLDAYFTELTGNVNSCSYGLFADGTLIGISLGHIKHWYSGTEYYIEELCICADKQGSGYGSTFITLIQNELRTRGIHALYLQTERSVPAYAFYKKLGFCELEQHVSFYKTF